MTEESEAEQWKRQYFDQLQELETREKHWRQSDELLRKTISRLTVAADGQDENLDRQLVELRNAIRERADNVQLQAAIDGMSDALIRLADTSSTHYVPEKAAGGFLQRLFGRRTNRPQATADGRKTAAAQQAPQQAAGVASVREILIRLLERLSLPDDLLERVAAVRNQIEAANEQGAWEPIWFRPSAHRRRKSGRGSRIFCWSSVAACRKLTTSSRAANSITTTVSPPAGNSIARSSRAWAGLHPACVRLPI